MIVIEKIDNEIDLLNKLKNDIKNYKQEKVVFLGGHFPLFYSKENDIAVENISHWGHFSTYTLELSCEIADYAKKIGKKIEFIFIVDDRAYEETSGLNPKERSRRRNKLYNVRSGKNASLPDDYKKILYKYGFSENDILRQNHGKAGRHDCLYFSEKILKASTKNIDNACAREYTEFIENPKYFNKEQSYLIAFIPNRCKKHICDVALAYEIKDLHASHIFMETMMPCTTKKDLFKIGRGVTYRKE